MSASFEEVFLAIAVKNKFLTRENAVACLASFRSQASGSARPITDLILERKLLSPEQVSILTQGAQKVMGGPPAAAPPPDPIPGYRISGKLGTGGTATVFLADDMKGGRGKVALKILQPARAKDPKALAGFIRESELLVGFDHPNLVKGYEAGQAGPLAYVAMEYLDGESVQDVLERDTRVSEARALEIILEVAKALEYTQTQGIVHRDIKPGNIMLLRDGRIKLCDLGFALPIGSVIPEGAEETTSGTVQYMSPEQARGQRDIDVRADIYSLGASLYHMVMGELPFSGADSLEVMAKQVMEALNSSEIKNRRISRHMHYFIERMMSKEKALRYATPRELIDDISEQIEGFRSLEFRPEQASEHTTSILRRISGSDDAPKKGETRFAKKHTTVRRLPPRRP